MAQSTLKFTIVTLLKLSAIVFYLITLFYVAVGTYAGVYYFGAAPSRVEVPLWIEGTSTCGQYPGVSDCKSCPIVAFGDMPVLSSAASYYDANIELKLSVTSSSQNEYVSIPFTSELTLTRDPPPLVNEFCQWRHILDLKRRAPGTNALYPGTLSEEAIGASKRGVVPYKRRLHRLVTSLFWTPFEILGLHVPAQAVSTSIVHNVPRPSKNIRFAALTIDQSLDVLEIKLVWMPRHGGARYFMYNYRLLSLLIGVPLIWSILVVCSIITVISLKMYLTGKANNSRSPQSPALWEVSDFKSRVRQVSEASAKTQPALIGSSKKTELSERVGSRKKLTEKVSVAKERGLKKAPSNKEPKKNEAKVEKAKKSEPKTEKDKEALKLQRAESENQNTCVANADTTEKQVEPEIKSKINEGDGESLSQTKPSTQASPSQDAMLIDPEAAGDIALRGINSDDINLTPPATNFGQESTQKSPEKPEISESDILEQVYSNIMVSPDSSIQTIDSEIEDLIGPRSDGNHPNEEH